MTLKRLLFKLNKINFRLIIFLCFNLLNLIDFISVYKSFNKI